MHMIQSDFSSAEHSDICTFDVYHDLAACGVLFFITALQMAIHHLHPYHQHQHHQLRF